MNALVRLAWRLLAGRPGLAWMAVGCIAVGIAARGAVDGTVAAFSASAAREARAVLAADLEVGSGTPFDTPTRAAVAAVLPAGARQAEMRTLTAMAAGGTGAVLVELRAIGPGWPLAGRLAGEPADAVAALDGTEPAALADPDLLARLGLAVGGRLRIGAGDFRIAGTIAAEPAGASSSFFRLGPRVYVPLAALAGAGLDGPAVRARHLLLAALPDATAADAAAAALRSRLGLPADQAEAMGGGASQPPVTVRSANEAATQGARAIARVADFLHLVALLALAMGALGVAALAGGMMRLQAEDLAVLRVLGATRGRAAAAFALQAAGLGAAGGAAGSLAGAAIAAGACLAMGLAPALPEPGGLLSGIALGVGAALLASAGPALALARMEPLAVLRGEAPPPAALPARLILVMAAIAVAVVAAALEARSWTVGPAMAAGAVLTALVLAAAMAVVLPLAARLRPRSFALRHGFANLARPGRGATALAVALGLAAALAAALLVQRASIAAELAPGRLDAAPSFFAIDVQDDQREAFAAELTGRGLAPNLRPMVRARLTAIDGGDAADGAVGADRDAETRAFFRRREQNLTWAAAPGPGEALIEGAWPARPDEVAVEARWAQRTGVRLGSRLAFDVQGVAVTATVTGLRRIDWWTLQPNFFICFGPGALDGAPAVWVGTVPAAEPAVRRKLAAELAARFPNISLIDIQDAAAQARQAVDRAAAGVAAVAIVALLAALAVVAGTVAASARERRGEAALVRAIGGTRATVAASVAAEYALAALLATLAGSALGLLGGRALTGLALDATPVVPWDQLGLLAAMLTATAAGTALLAARRAWRVLPLAALREE